MLHHQKLLHLRYEDFFGLFPAHIRSQLMNKSETRQCKTGQFVFKRGEEGPWIGAILAGRVRISMRSTDGKEMLLSMFERGEIFGERAMLDGLPRGADAIAEEDTTFLAIKREEILPLLFQYPESMFCIVRLLCNRLLRYTEHMELYAMQDLPTRLASFLLFLVQTYGEKVDGQWIIRSGLNQADLGQKLGASRESINRQLKIFATQGAISLHDSEISVLDREKLEEFCQDMVPWL